MDKKEFSRKLKLANVNTLKTLIPALGLHGRNEEILMLKYVNQDSLWDISEKMVLTYESASNLLSTSRLEMKRLMNDDYELYPKEIQILIDKMLK